MANSDILETLVVKRAVNGERDRQTEEGMLVDVSATAADVCNNNRNAEVRSLLNDERQAEDIIGEKEGEPRDEGLRFKHIFGEEEENENDLKSNGERDDHDDHDVDELNGGKNGRRRGRRKQKGGKHHRKQWKPYSKLSWEEKQKRDDKETIRATKKRDDQFASGQPMAPYNTTQFLMDQHQPSPVAKTVGSVEPGQEEMHHINHPAHAKDDGSASYESSDEYYESPDDDENIFLAKDFSEAYENFHAERLQELSKEELVREYVELETKNEKLEKKIVKMKKELRSSSERDRRSSEESVDMAKVLKIELEMKKLTDENARILRENEFLKAAAGKLTAE